MALTNSVSKTGDQDVDGLLSGIKWANLSVSYSFPPDSSFYGAHYSGANEPSHDFAPLNAAQQATAREAVNQVSTFTNLNLVATTESSTLHADIRWATSSEPPTAWAYYPGQNAGGDIWIGDSYSQYAPPSQGDYGFLTFLHEFGHALGLKHGHETNVYGAMTTAHDSLEYSVMTYNSYLGANAGGYTNEAFGFPQT